MLLALEGVLLAGTLAAAAFVFEPSEWHPAFLVGLLLALAVLGQWLSIEIPGGQLSASMIGIVLALSLLGPGPAAACGLAAALLRSALTRRSPADLLNNVAILTVSPFVGGVLVRVLSGRVTHLGHGASQGFTFGLVVFGAFVVTIVCTFLLFALDGSTGSRRRVSVELRELIPLLPGELATGALATILAVGYAGIGTPMLIASLVILLIFRQLTVALLRSEERAEQLFVRSRQLVGLQLGVLRTLVRALGMRDQRTAHHAAAVARYAKTLALKVGCDADEQDMIHTAGLLHDIGKFTWPDSILRAEVIDEQDLETVRLHPQEGSILVGALDGYGDVAEMILYHHERVDGRGYPAGLIGTEIPVGSRILAICSNYDTMTALDSYRVPMPPEEAMAELQRAAQNGQLDADLVDAFLEVLTEEGPMFAQEADFETELEFDRRVRRLVNPGTGPDNGTATAGPKVVAAELLASVSALGQRAIRRG